MDDPIVEEVRRVREAFAAQFNYDIHAMCEYLRELDRKSGRKVVDLSKSPRKEESAPIKKYPFPATQPQRALESIPAVGLRPVAIYPNPAALDPSAAMLTAATSWPILASGCPALIDCKRHEVRRC